MRDDVGPALLIGHVQVPFYVSGSPMEMVLGVMISYLGEIEVSSFVGSPRPNLVPAQCPQKMFHVIAVYGSE